MTTLNDILKKKLLFPMPSDTTIRTGEEPVIDEAHPIYDFYNDKNWRNTVADKDVNKYVIMPATITAPHAGLFTAKGYDASVTAVVGNADGGWEDIDPADSVDVVQQKLRSFVKAVAVGHCRTNIYTSFQYGVDDEADTMKYVFLCSDANSPFCDEAPADAAAAKAKQRLSRAYATISKLHTGVNSDVSGGMGSHDNLNDALFDGMSLYWAYRSIDEVFPASDYYFLDRLKLITKLIFVAKLLSPSEDANQTQFDQIMKWVYNDILQYAVVDANTEGSLDDMFRNNVKTSEQIKAGSVALQGAKQHLVSAQSNLQSLSSSDSMVKRQRRNSVIIFWVVFALLVLQLLSLSASAYFNSYLTGYVIIISVTLVVVALETRRTLQQLINF